MVLIHEKKVISYIISLDLNITKKSLKLAKGWSEFVNRRRTDKTMAKKKGHNDLQNITHKTKDPVTQTPPKI